MTPQGARLLLLDREDYSAQILTRELERNGFSDIVRMASCPEAPPPEAGTNFDLAIFNYHYQHHASLAECSSLKKHWPGIAVVAVVSAGPAMKLVRTWAKETNHLDVVIEKPLSDERFFQVVRDLVSARQAARRQQAHLARITNLVPEPALAFINRPERGEAEMFEAVVLFTDIRRSTQVAALLSPQAYFATLNRTLSAQSRLLEKFGGSVVKYTGDGILAIFRSMGRSHVALRCALALARDESQGILPFGIGVAHGLIFAGFVGDSQQVGQRRQYDVIGSTVHLAARLCQMAQRGEVIATQDLYRSARVPDLPQRTIETDTIRGFDRQIACVAFQPALSLQPAASSP